MAADSFPDEFTNLSPVSPVSPGTTRKPSEPAEPLLKARSLMAEGKHGTIFGPIDLDLYPGDLMVVRGERGAGKSAFLMALAARFRAVQGELTINGIDALSTPYKAMEHTAVARLGNFVAPEDRLTVAESISERAYLDAISLDQAEMRLRHFEEIAGIRVERSVEIEELDPLSRAVGSVVLVALKPASVIVVDDVDIMVPHHDQALMYQLLAKFAHSEGCIIIASAIDGDTAPSGSVCLTLSSHKRLHVHPSGESGGQVSVVAELPMPHTTPGKDPEAINVSYQSEKCVSPDSYKAETTIEKPQEKA